jgi:hypothetical protein
MIFMCHQLSLMRPSVINGSGRHADSGFASPHFAGCGKERVSHNDIITAFVLRRNFI